MKKIIFCLFAACLSITLIPNELKAASDSIRIQNSGQSIEAEILMNRLEEIKSIDKSTLSKENKRALRKEVRTIDSQLKALSGGIYISAGLLILILVLLIVLV